MNYVEALDHPDLFGRWFGAPSWAAWRVVERAIFGLALELANLPLFRELIGRDQAPDQQVTEAWIIAGRRSAVLERGRGASSWRRRWRAAGLMEPGPVRLAASAAGAG